MYIILENSKIKAKKHDHGGKNDETCINPSRNRAKSTKKFTDIFQSIWEDVSMKESM